MNSKLSDITNDVFIPANDNEPPQAKPPVFDPALFEDDLINCDMSEEHRLEALRILWDMMVACADMGWGVEPTQTICAKLVESAFEETPDSPDAIESAVNDNNALSASFEESRHKKGGE